MPLSKFKIILDKQLDQSNFIDFFEAGNPMISEIFPQIKAKEDIVAAIDYTYSHKEQYLDPTISFLNNNIDKLEKIANIISQQLDYSWDGISLITIVPAVCPVCPRFIEDNKFMVAHYFNENTILRICAHGMVHFLYFKKLKDSLPDQNIDTEYPGNEWLLSEIVAPIITNSIEIQEIVHDKDELFTPEPNMITEQKLSTIIEHYRKKQNLLDFRDKALKIL